MHPTNNTAQVAGAPRLRARVAGGLDSLMRKEKRV